MSDEEEFADVPVSLRAIADRLMRYKIPNKADKYGFDHLLGILKSAQIKAAAFFPDLFDAPVTIPAEHWRRLGPDALECLLKNKDRKKGKIGTYKVTLMDLAAEVYRVASEQDRASSPSELSMIRLIQCSNHSASVVVFESEWRRYLDEWRSRNGGLTHEAEGRTPGRPPMNWVPVYLELAALLWRKLDAFEKGEKHANLAEELAANLKSKGMEDVPKSSTIRDHIAKVRSRVNELKNQRLIK